MATGAVFKLIANDGKLKLEYVGDYVGGEKEHHKETLAAILEVMDFSEVPLDSALRRFIALIKLPGESQKIDRILTIFATRYLECNPTAFDHEDTVMILCFSLVMLNVDAHNDNIPKNKKMNAQQYVRNLKGIQKDQSSPDEQMLRGFYQRVSRYEWAVEERPHTAVMHEGWLCKASTKKVGGSAKRMYGLLSSRALYFFRDAKDKEPQAFIKLEGLSARPATKGSNAALSFELFPTAEKKSDEPTKAHLNGHMIKLEEQKVAILLPM
jgi:hypothetical protein